MQDGQAAQEAGEVGQQVVRVQPTRLHCHGPTAVHAGKIQQATASGGGVCLWGRAYTKTPNVGVDLQQVWICSSSVSLEFLRLACGLSLANVVFLWLASCGFVAGSWCVCLHTQGLLSFGTWATAVLLESFGTFFEKFTFTFTFTF